MYCWRSLCGASTPGSAPLISRTACSSASRTFPRTPSSKTVPRRSCLSPACSAICGQVHVYFYVYIRIIYHIFDSGILFIPWIKVTSSENDIFWFVRLRRAVLFCTREKIQVSLNEFHIHRQNVEYLLFHKPWSRLCSILFKRLYNNVIIHLHINDISL